MYVGITGKLLYEVRRGINMMQDKEINSLTRPSPLTPADVEPTIWGSYLELRDKMPERWMTKLNTQRIKFTCCIEDIEVEPLFQVPPDYRRFTAIEILDNPNVDAWEEYYKNEKDAKTRWDGVQTQVNQFLNKCKSLNEALKLFPEIAAYIPTELIEKTKEKAGPRIKADQAAKIEGLDKDSLITAAIIARISEGL
jgi:hypothetical protein